MGESILCACISKVSLLTINKRPWIFTPQKLGFQVKHDIPVGEDRWLTLLSGEPGDDTELLLEPSGHPAVGPFKKALKDDGLPWTAFSVEDCDAEHARLKGLGVEFTMEPTVMGDAKVAIFDDTCGNLIQIIQLPE